MTKAMEQVSKKNHINSIVDFPEEITEEGVKIYGETSYENQMAVLSHYLHNLDSESNEMSREDILVAINFFLTRKKNRIAKSWWKMRLFF